LSNWIAKQNLAPVNWGPRSKPVSDLFSPLRLPSEGDEQSGRTRRQLFSTLEDIGDLCRRPVPASRRRHAAGAQDAGDLAQALALGSERLDQRQDVGGEPIGGSLHAAGPLGAGLVEARVAKPQCPLPWLALAPLWRARDHRPLLFGERGVDVQDERVDVGPELGYDESDALGHQARDERNVAAEPIELGHDDRAPELARPCAPEVGYRGTPSTKTLGNRRFAA